MATAADPDAVVSNLRDVKHVVLVLSGKVVKGVFIELDWKSHVSFD